MRDYFDRSRLKGTVKISGILLAGGKSKRMGENKAFLRFRGKELYTWSLEVLQALCDDIVISAPENIFPIDFPYPTVPDEIPGKGPLSGLHSCLRYVRHDRAVVLSCDIPFITVAYIQALLSEMHDAPAIAGLNKNGGIEPLAGIYSSHLWLLAEDLIHSGQYKMSDFLSRTEASLVDVQALGFDPDRLFYNVNTRGDMDAADDLFVS